MLLNLQIPVGGERAGDVREGTKVSTTKKFFRLNDLEGDTYTLQDRAVVVEENAVSSGLKARAAFPPVLWPSPFP